MKKVNKTFLTLLTVLTISSAFPSIASARDTRGMIEGGASIAFGLAEKTVGALMCTTGVGCAAGGLMFIHGSKNIIYGAEKMAQAAP